MNMTSEEAKEFSEKVLAFPHKHSEVDAIKDVAAYVLDLLRQGYTVKSIVKKLRNAQDLAGSDHRYGDCLVRFSQAIRRCNTTRAWVSFHMPSEVRKTL